MVAIHEVDSYQYYILLLSCLQPNGHITSHVHEINWHAKNMLLLLLLPQLKFQQP